MYEEKILLGTGGSGTSLGRGENDREESRQNEKKRLKGKCVNGVDGR